MARPKAFSESDVLDRAMRQFWAHGFEGTSIRDLVAATGVNRASLYGTFGDKERLFQLAVERYLIKISGERLALLERPGPVMDAFRAYFDDLVTFACSEGRGLGCLLTNTAVEIAPHDARIAKALQDALDRVEAAFRTTIERGQASGEIASTKDARSLARFLLTLVQGLRVLIRAGAPRHVLEDAIDVALGTLGPEPGLRCATMQREQ